MKTRSVALSASGSDPRITFGRNPYFYIVANRPPLGERERQLSFTPQPLDS
jgi:hypothetical protein